MKNLVNENITKVLKGKSEEDIIESLMWGDKVGDEQIRSYIVEYLSNEEFFELLNKFSPLKQIEILSKTLRAYYKPEFFNMIIERTLEYMEEQNTNGWDDIKKEILDVMTNDDLTHIIREKYIS